MLLKCGIKSVLPFFCFSESPDRKGKITVQMKQVRLLYFMTKEASFSLHFLSFPFHCRYGIGFKISDML